MLQTLASCFIFLLNLFLPLFPTLVLGAVVPWKLIAVLKSGDVVALV